jgi:putative two-component system response regulator
MNVLIVDDDEMALAALSTTLAKAGYRVETAADGKTALEVVRAGRCRLVISDWQMPGMNGLELCRAVRESDLPGYVYVILLTANDAPEQKVAGLSAGADDFVAKPYNSAELIARVRSGERVLTLETRDVAIFAMAKLAESRDPETGAHLERVRSYSKVLAQQLATCEKHQAVVDAEYIRLVYQTSPLHDIGKVGIPDSVLLKPGRLSDREFEIMKTHTAMGAETLAAALRQFPGVKFLEMARDIALSHHERFDGSGYPNRLAGERIPLCGRIVALADVYDALTSKRVYKNAFSHDIAKSTIVSERGVHFDPDVVDAFLACEGQFMQIRERYAEVQAGIAA